MLRGRYFPMLPQSLDDKDLRARFGVLYRHLYMPGGGVKPLLDLVKGVLIRASKEHTPPKCGVLAVIAQVLH